MRNLLSTESENYLNNNWQVLINSKEIKGKGKKKQANDILYTEEDKAIFKKIENERRKFLSNNQEQNNNIITLLNILKDIAQDSQKKEYDFYNFLASKTKDGSDLLKRVNTLNSQTLIYFNTLINNQELSQIKYDENDLEALNTLFWGDIKETNNGIKTLTPRGNFLAAISKLKSQSFFDEKSQQFTIEETEKMEKMDDQINKLILDFKNNSRGKIQTETIEKVEATGIKSQLFDNSGKAIINDTILIDLIDNIISEFIDMVTPEIVNVLKEKVPKKAREFLDSLDSKNLAWLEITKLQSQINKNPYMHYAITQISNKKTGTIDIQLNTINDFYFNIDKQGLVKVILQDVKKMFQSRTFDSDEQFFRILSINIIQSFLNHIEKHIQTNFQKVPSIKTSFVKIYDYQIQIINDISHIFNNYIKTSYDVKTNEKERKAAIAFLKEQLRENSNLLLNQLIEQWINIINTEILQLSNVDVVKASQYFLQLSSNIKQNIIDEVNYEGGSFLDREILKAVDQYYKLSWSNTGKAGNKAVFNGTISEIFITYLLREAVSDGNLNNSDMVLQKGGDAQESGEDEDNNEYVDTKQSVTDIEVRYGNNKGVGMQAKHYETNSIDLYVSSTPIMLYEAQRYLTQEEIDSFIYLMGNQYLLNDKKDENFSDLVPYLYYRLDNFIRFKHASYWQTTLQNNFYIFNLNVVPASIIFLYFAWRIKQTHKDLSGKMIKGKSLFQLEGSTEENSFILTEQHPYYNLFTGQSIRSKDSNNLIDKLKTFKIYFRGMSINIDSKDIPISIFQKRKD